MRIIRRHPRPRRPHPDARVESELQRIISLRNAVARKENQLESNDDNLRRLRNIMRANSGSDYTGERIAQIDGLQQDSARLEAEIIALHDEIAARVAKIDDIDLVFLDGRD